MRNQTATILMTILCLGNCAFGQNDDWSKDMAAGDTAMVNRQYASAENFYRNALKLAEEQLEQKNSRLPRTLIKLAQACDAQSKRQDAEAYAMRSTETLDNDLKTYKPQYPGDESETAVAATILDQAGDIFAAHQKYSEAEGLYLQHIKFVEALAADEKSEPKNRKERMRWFFRSLDQFPAGAKSNVADADEKLAILYFREQKFDQAAVLFEKSDKIRESEPGTDKRLVANSLGNLASCYTMQGKYDQAEAVFKHALTIFEQSHWMERPETVRLMNNYALMLKKAGRGDEAKTMSEKAEALRIKIQQSVP